MENTDFKFLTIILQSETEKYKNDYDELKANLKKALQKIEDGYKPGILKEEAIKKAEKNFDEQVVEVRQKYAAICQEEIERVRETEMEKIKTINEGKLAKLKAISEVPLTAEEMTVLIDNYKLSDDYWCERYIKMMAEKNGFDVSGVMEADYSTKMSILDQFQQQADEMIKYYDGRDQKDEYLMKKTLRLNLTPEIMQNASALWYGEQNVVSNEDKAYKAFLTVKSKPTDIEKGLVIGNVLRNSKGEARNEILTALATDNSISQFAFQLSGFNEELTAFRNEKADKYIEAKKHVKEFEKYADNKEAAQAYLQNHSNNEFFIGLVKSETQRNNVFKSFVGESKTEEGASGENTI